MINYIFDCGKVLVRYDPAELTAACTPKEHCDAVCAVAFDRLYWDRLDDGSITEEEIKKAIRPRLTAEQYPFACAALDGWVQNLPPVAGMLELIQRLKAQGGKIYLLSNISKGFAEDWAKNPYLKELFALFDGLVCSGPIGLTKPHREIYEYLLNTYHLKAEECIFIDDAPINIAGAERCGIRGYLFDGDAQKLEAYLREQ